MDRVPGFEPGGWRFEPSSVQVFGYSMQLSPLSLTSSEFADAIRAKIGKGREHALLLYQEWHRTGKMTGSKSAFSNARTLYDQIVKETRFDLLDPVPGRTDGCTEKFLFKTKEGLEIESVLIPMEAGATLCVSSQVGCRMGCRFCETGRMGLLKNLSPAEIVSQVFYARHHLGAEVRNVVFMGMGEPFDNYEAVMQAFRVISDPNGLNIGPKHITISTSGKVPEIIKFANEEAPCPFLAVSISAPTNELRTKLMPINRTHSMQELYDAIHYYNGKTGKQVLAAYVLIKGVNDAEDQAKELALYLKGLDVKINLIPYNPQTHDRFQAPDSALVERFKLVLVNEGYAVLVRKSRGEQIMAACGQLGKKQVNLHCNKK